MFHGTVIQVAGDGDLFADLQRPEDGGLNGINFKVVQSKLIGGYVCDALGSLRAVPCEPYNGSDAYSPRTALCSDGDN